MNIVGQKSLLKTLDEQIADGRYPRFSIMCGYDGYGKKTIASYITEKLKYNIVFFESKIDDVRRCIEMAYNYPQPIFYVIKDAQEMSVSAKNSMLKLVEEPPENAYVILLCSSKEFLLETILSRGVLYQLSDYTEQELTEFIQLNFPSYTNAQIRTVLDVCRSPGEIISCSSVNLEELVSDCVNIVENLPRASLGNILKITKTVRTKDSEDNQDGYPFVPFLNSLQNQLYKKIYDDKTTLELKNRYLSFMNLICSVRRGSFNKSMNKAMLFDSILVGAYNIWNSGT